MCLAVLALHMHPRWPLVIAANRDEFHDRPALPMHWWQGASPRVLAGQDLTAGGTWMGVSDTGRIALLTNVRAPARHRADAPSRGTIVVDWLRSRDSIETEAQDYRLRGCNPFNLLVADEGGSRWWCIGDEASRPHALGPGIYGLSNARLDTPWPKARRLKAALGAILDEASDPGELSEALFAALRDRHAPADDELPHTGVDLSIERMLAAAFVSGSHQARPYGTRTSTLVFAERSTEGHRLLLHERSFDVRGAPAHEVQQTMVDWPWQPRELRASAA